MGTNWYPSAPANDFTPQIREFLRSQSATSSYGPKSIPWQAVDLPMVTVLPDVKVSQDRDEVNLLNTTSKTVQRYVFSATLNQWVEVDAKTTVVTALPTTGLYEGRQIVYDTGTSGVRWQFVYDTSDGTTYPWLFIGGTPLIETKTDATTRAVSTYGDVASGAATTFTLALAGDYLIEHGANMQPGSAGFAMYSSFSVAGATALDSDGAESYFGAGTAPGQVTVMNRAKKTGLTAATTIQQKFKMQGATAGNVDVRWLSITPVRVG